MLCINNKVINDIINKELYIGKYTINGKLGYNINLSIEFFENNKKGYINLSAGYEKKRDINLFLNRTFKGVPFSDIGVDINLFEVYDTYNFFDTEIETEIELNIGNMNNKEIEIKFNVNDELIKIEFNDVIKEVFKC